MDEETKVSEMPECPSVSMEWRDISFQIGEKKILHEAGSGVLCVVDVAFLFVTSRSLV